MSPPTLFSDQAVSLEQCVAALYNEPEYADLTVRCGSKEWRVHKAIVCMRSTFFRTACKKEWKHDGIVDFDDDDPDAIDAIIAHLYVGSSFADQRSSFTLGPIRYEFEVFCTADKYNLPELSHLAALKLLSLLEPFDIKHRSSFLDLVPLFFNESPSTEDTTRIREAILHIAREGIYTTAVTTLNKNNPDGMFAEAIMGLVAEGGSFATHMVSTLNEMRRQSNV